MKRFLIGFSVVFLIPPLAMADPPKRGVIPAFSTPKTTFTVTPITSFPERESFDMALEDLRRAKELYLAGYMEAASDSALEAYDEFEMWWTYPRKKRKALRVHKREAAKVYIETGIKTIQQFVKEEGSTTKAKKEGRERLGDLREVARNYRDLNKQLNEALEAM